jgi:CubicO group peptidase (beta-lactamase class C family)
MSKTPLFIFIYLTILQLTGYAANFDTPADSIARKHGLLGFSLVAVHRGEVVQSMHYGMASVEENRLINNKTLYRVASVSKVITAIAFMILEQDGLVGLDTDVSDILGFEVLNPHHPDIAITPRMLMTHTSGLSDGGNYMNFLLNETYENPAAPSIAELITRNGKWYSDEQWLQNAPGSFFSYSNLGYGLLGTIIEKLTGQCFDLFVENRILNPLNISGGYNVREIDIQNLATLYRKPDDSWEPQADHFPNGNIPKLNYMSYIPGTNALLFAPQGGLRISAEDLAKILIILMNRGSYGEQQILSSASVQKMTEVQWIYNGSNGDNSTGLFNAWGLGLFISSMKENSDIIIPGFRMIGHYGQAYGLLSGMYFCPDADFGLIFILNGKAGSFNPGVKSALYLEEEALIDYLFQTVIGPRLQERNK